MQDIKFIGHTANPTDYDAQDGSLALSYNAVFEDGSLRPVYQPAQIGSIMAAGKTLMFIHKTADFTHYILYSTVEDGGFHTIRWCSSISNSSTIITRLPSNITVYGYNSIGNTLVVMTDTGIMYFKWKSDTSTYVNLGSHLPEIELSFGLRSNVVLGDEFVAVQNDTFYPASARPTDDGDSYSFPSSSSTDSEKVKRYTQTILSQVNKFIADNATNEGKFIFPFFVRYAYRLYDGSLTMHSAPVLMIPNSDLTPRAFITEWDYADASTHADIWKVKARIGAMVADLDYMCITSDIVSTLNNWGDIIQSVDIFISAPIYTYNQAGNVEGWTRLAESAQGYTVSRIASTPTNHRPTPSSSEYTKAWTSPLLIDHYGSSDAVKTNCRGHEEFLLPRHSVDKVTDAINDCSNFYFLCSIKASDLSLSSRSTISVSSDYLGSLVAREVMSDDYDSHDTIIAKKSFNYNSRLTLANITKVLNPSVHPLAAVAYSSKTYTYSTEWTDGGSSTYSLYVFIKKGGKEIVVKHTNSATLAKMTSASNPFVYFYYPDADAYQVVLAVTTDSTTTYLMQKLQRHNFLNGAYYFGGWNAWWNATMTAPSASSDRSVPQYNKIYTSEVANPFFFPVTGITSVGSGDVIGITTAAQALSQGQFGQFPLYAFTTEGIWALEVGGDGSFSARQPISRDVCTNAESITQLDGSVLFATSRGIMEIAGSKVVCISDAIATDSPFNYNSLPHSNLVGGHNYTTFSSFLSGCRMVYDYTHQRVVVFNPLNTYAYVLSLKSKQWGTMNTNLYSVVPSYPDAYANGKTNSSNQRCVYSFATTSVTMPTSSIITRPLKLGQPHALKSIHNIIIRGIYSNESVKFILYGSNNLSNWFVVGSSSTGEIRNLRGNPYKYFRVAMQVKLNKSLNHSLSEITVDEEVRHTNMLN